METCKQFIIIDDNAVDTFIARETVQRYTLNATIRVFVEGKLGLEYIQARYAHPVAANTILFLDLNMPVMSGWEFLEKFALLSPKIRNHFKIYVLSSSNDEKDIARALFDTNVTDYIIKPLTEKALVSCNVVNAFNMMHRRTG